jgi:diguanylate cyclase (GGDEF)-like protein
MVLVLNRIFSRWPPARVLLFCFGLTVLTGYIDYVSGPEFAFSIFYLPPLALTAWHVNRRSSIVLAIFSALLWAVADHLSGNRYTNVVAPFWNTGVRLGFFVITLGLVANIRSKMYLLEELSLLDSLTGIANSRKFYLEAEDEWARMKRSGKPMTLAYVDLDNFKTVNDTQGHPMGDSLLKEVAVTMKHYIRSNDVVARLGGDEFALLFPETDQEVAATILKRLQKALLETMQKQGHPVTFSIGVVTLVKPLGTIREMVRIADELMYQVKHDTKNALGFKVIAD